MDGEHQGNRRYVVQRTVRNEYGMYINKNIVKELEVIKYDGDFIKFIKENDKGYIIVPVICEVQGYNDVDDIEYCTSFELVPLQNLCFDYTCGEIYVNVAKYDYMMTELSGNMIGSQGKRSDCLATNGVSGVRYNQRYEKYILYHNKWLNGVRVITYDESKTGVCYNVRLYEITEINLENGVSLDDLWYSKVCSCRITANDFLESNVTRVTKDYKGINRTTKVMLGTNDLRWEEHDCNNVRFQPDNTGYSPDVATICKLLGGKGVTIGEQIQYCTSQLHINKPLWYRKLLYSIAFFEWLRGTELQFKGWFTKVKYRGITFVILKEWYDKCKGVGEETNNTVEEANDLVEEATNVMKKPAVCTNKLNNLKKFGNCTGKISNLVKEANKKPNTGVKSFNNRTGQSNKTTIVKPKKLGKRKEVRKNGN